MDLTRYEGAYIDRPTPGELAQMVQSGTDLDDIAADFGCATSTLRGDLYRAGYSPDGATKRAHHNRQQPEDTLPAPPSAIPGSWVEDALCAEVDTEIFFPEKGGSTRTAKATCARCPVAAECLDFALANNERYGIWGGASERDRRKLAGQPEDTGACGTYPKGYNRHRNRGEQPCDECREAANIYARNRREHGSSRPVDLSTEEVA